MMTQNPPAPAPRPHEGPDLSLAIIEHAPLPIANVTGAGHIIHEVNPAFCRLLNKPREALVGQPFAEQMPENDACLPVLDRVFRTGKSEKHIGQGDRESSPLVWTYTLWPVTTGERPPGVMIQITETARLQEQTVAMNEALILGSLRQHELTETAESANARLQEEISERIRTEELLHRAQAQLSDRAGQLEALVAERTKEVTETNQQLETFVYSIAHDLRAPLRAMQGFSTLLVEEAGAALSETGRDFAHRIDKSAQFMDALLADLLAFSRISQQRVELASVSLNTIVGTVLSGLQRDITEKNARVENVGPWPAVLAHEATLTQVLSNLLSNALKFVAPGVAPRVRLRAEEQAGFVRVWVEDNGLGIAPAHQTQIFRLFIRLHGEKYPGTGIGLVIVQKGLDRMGGRGGVESTLGEGSRFWFELRKA
jgi:signal transduction histidine kinase